MTSAHRIDADPADDHGETVQERDDRHWSDILQEVRVIQTGTQILTGFLLTLPFQQRFAQLDPYEVGIYLVLVVTSAVATALALTPVALHRALFRRKAKATAVNIASRLLKATLTAVGLTLCGTATLIFDTVLGLPAGLIAGAIAFLLVLAFWLALPVIVRRKHPPS
ncbi:MAG: DUF6328 family protein [Rhodoglobus sp.]